MQDEQFIHYTKSPLYTISSTSKYLKRMILNYFSKKGMDLTPEEFLALDIIYLHPGICQRDLAKELLKDRAGAGRILDSLEAKGLVERFGTTKGNHPVKNMKLTEKGTETLQTAQEQVRPSVEKFREVFPQKDIDELNRILEKLKKVLSEHVETQI